MNRAVPWRPNAATAICVVATAAALATTAIAGPNDERARGQGGLPNSVTSKRFKKAVRKEIRRLAPNLTVAAADRADFSSSANRADNARYADASGFAGIAESVTGVRASQISYSHAAPSGDAVIFKRLGVTLRAGCASGNNVTLAATTAGNGASIYTSVIDTETNDNNHNAALDNGTFDSGVNFDLLAGAEGDPSMINFAIFPPGSSTDSITGSLVTDESGDGCRVSGHVLEGFLPPP